MDTINKYPLILVVSNAFIYVIESKKFTIINKIYLN